MSGEKVSGERLLSVSGLRESPRRLGGRQGVDKIVRMSPGNFNTFTFK